MTFPRACRGRWRHAVLLIALLAGCSYFVPELRSVQDPGARRPTDPPIKVHTLDGGLLILSPCQVEGETTLSGTGSRWGPASDDSTLGRFEVPVDSVALVEVQHERLTYATGVLTAVTIVTGVVTAI